MRNRVQLIGRLGKDPELRNLDNGKAVANFSIATTETWKDDRGEKKEHTEWHNCAVFGKQAETFSKYVRKGNQVAVEGKLRTRQWEKDGIKRYSTEIIVENFVFLESGKNNTDNHDNSPRNPVTSSPGVASDDLPF